MQSASNTCAIVLDAQDKSASVGICHGRKRLGHVPRHLAHWAELTLQAVKAALPLEKLAFLLAENPQLQTVFDFLRFIIYAISI